MLPTHSTLTLVPSLVITSYVLRGGSHAVHLACVVRHVTGCTTVTYPKIATTVVRLYCERAIGSYLSRTTAHNSTRMHRLAWGTELGHHSPVGGEAPGRVGRCGRSMRGRRRGHLLFVLSRRRRVISRRGRRVVGLIITLRGSVRYWGTRV